MKIAYVAGFFDPVQPDLTKAFEAQIDAGVVVWIPPYKHSGDFNFNLFKGAFFDAIARGAGEILICLFIMRAKESYLMQMLEAVVLQGKERAPLLSVRIQRFKNARDANGVIDAVRAFEPHSETPMPESLDGISGWITQRHGVRVMLHQRAVNNSKKSQYGDTALIYKALDFLGTEYWQMRTSSSENHKDRKARADAKLLELELEIGPAVSPSRAGEQGDDYFVSYPLGTETKRLLEFHLKKGDDRDEKFCLRIYFFWDKEKEMVVVGWLPSHLDTRVT